MRCDKMNELSGNNLTETKNELLVHEFGSDSDHPSSPSTTVAASPSHQPENYLSPSKHRQNRRRRRKEKEENTLSGAEDAVISKHDTAVTVSPVKQVQADIQRMPDIVSGRCQTDKPDEQGVTDLSSPKPEAKPRRKRKKKIQMGHNLYSQDTINDDIVHLQSSFVNEDSSVISSPKNHQQVWHSNVPSQPVGKIFVERKGGFKAFDVWKFSKRLARKPDDVENGNIKDRSPTALDIGLSLHCHIRQLANYCHGLLAGIAFWQCLMVYQFAPPSFSSDDFVRHYSFLSAPAQAIFYFLLAVSLISVMGRCDIGSNPLIVKLNSSFIAFIIYFITLVLSLFIADIDEKLSLYQLDTMALEDTEVQRWMNINLCRCVGAMLGWLVLAFCSEQDLLYDNFKNLRESE